MKRGLVRKFWIGATLLIIVLTAFAAGRNLIHAFKIRSQIRVLEREKALYEEKIARDSALIEQLKQDDFLEQYAREHFHMQRKGEKPMKAMARMPAVTSAIGVPRNDSGTSSNSNRSRIPAKSTSASAKPRAVETE